MPILNALLKVSNKAGLFKPCLFLGSNLSPYHLNRNYQDWLFKGHNCPEYKKYLMRMNI
jgi:hypothetical protein